jgi:alanine-alpha-ketoisovalerate/valine-pyruvate aminotransferase
MLTQQIFIAVVVLQRGEFFRASDADVRPGCQEFVNFSSECECDVRIALVIEDTQLANGLQILASMVRKLFFS